MATSIKRRQLHDTPRAGWGRLCDDVRGIIFSKLTVRDLARVAYLGREFNYECLKRTAQERDNLIAAGNNNFGKPFMSAVVTALKRSMHDLPHCDAAVNDTNGAGMDTCKRPLYISNAGEESVATSQSVYSVLAGPYEGMYGILRTHNMGIPHIALKLTHKPGALGNGRVLRHFFVLDCCELAGENCLEIRVNVEREAAEAALGLLTSIFTESPGGVVTSWASPPVIHITIMEGPDVPSGVREVKDLAAPLMSLVKSLEIQHTVIQTRAWLPLSPSSIQ